MRRILRQFFSIAGPGLIALGLIFVSMCYLNRWDAVVVVTLIPVWIWAIGGMGFSVLFGGLFKSRTCFVLFFAWFLFGLVGSDETRSLGREFAVAISGKREPTSEDTKTFRVVSINCDNGKVAAAMESVGLKPDIVFLQESPDKEAIVELQRALFEGQGSHVSHLGNTIVARGRFGKVEPVDSQKPTFRVKLNLPDGLVIEVANVSLLPSIPRFDVWKSGVVQEFSDNRVANRKTLRHLVRYREQSGGKGADLPPIIVGGGFFTPPGDDIFRMLRNANLEDATVSGNMGSGNTFPAKFPVLRFDQVWASEKLRPIKIETKRSEHSNHEIVVCEFELLEESQKEVN